MNQAAVLLSSSVASHSSSFGNSIGQYAKQLMNCQRRNMEAIYLLVISVLVFTSCKKNISIDFPSEHGSKLFIEGMLYPGQPPKIFISKSNSFFSANVTPQQVFARGAAVKITTGTNMDLLVPDSTFNKFRCRWEPFYRGSVTAEYGKTYTLEVNFEGKTYTASATINQHKPVIESIEYTPEFFDAYGGHDGVIVKITDHPATKDYYRFQMNRMIDKSVKHAHALDGLINNCASENELFPVTDIGRIVFTDENADGKQLTMTIEVSYEYKKDDEGWVFIQSLDKNSADFYKELDDQLQAIYNPFVEPVFLTTKIPGAVGVFGSAVLSDSVRFVYPQDNP